MPDSSSGSSAEKSISRSIDSIMGSVSFSISEADKVLGRPHHAPQVPQKRQSPENALQSFNGTLAAGQLAAGQQGLIATGGGGYEYSITGPDAPVKARILNSMLNKAGAADAGRRSISLITTTDRVVHFRLPHGQEEAIADRFNTIDAALQHEQAMMTRLFIASRYLDGKKGPDLGSKLWPSVELSLDGRVGFPTIIETNDQQVIDALSKAGFFNRPIRGFKRSDMQPVSGGVKFEAGASQLQKVLSVIQDVSKLHALAAPPPRALPAAPKPALPQPRTAQAHDSDNNIIGH